MALLKTGTRIFGNANVDNQLTVGSILVTNTTLSTSNTTGAIVLSGGIATRSSIYSGNIIITGLVNSNGITFTDGTRQTRSGLEKGNTLTQTVVGPVIFSDNDSSTSNTTGALIVTGGIGVLGNVYSGSHFITGAGNGVIFVDGTIQTTAGSSVANTIYLQNVNNSQNVRLDFSNTRMNISDGVDASQNVSISTQNSFITIIQGVDTGQNTAIAATDNKMQSAYNQANTGTVLAQSTTSFSRILVSGQPDAIANIANTPVTFVAGSGMLITSDGVSNTITFNSTGGFSGGTISNQLIIANNTTAISNVTGALQVQGGVGVTGNIYVGGTSDGVDGLYTDVLRYAANGLPWVMGGGGGGGGASPSGYLANTIIVANSTGYLANSNSFFIDSNNTIILTGNLIANSVIVSGGIEIVTSILANNVVTASQSVVLNDITNQFDNRKCVFNLVSEQSNVVNIMNSRNLEVIINGAKLAPYVTELRYPWLTPYDSFKGHRVVSSNTSSRVVIYNPPAPGEQAILTLINNSSSPQNRRYPYSAATIALGD